MQYIPGRLLTWALTLAKCGEKPCANVDTVSKGAKSSLSLEHLGTIGIVSGAKEQRAGEPKKPDPLPFVSHAECKHAIQLNPSVKSFRFGARWQGAEPGSRAYHT